MCFLWGDSDEYLLGRGYVLQLRFVSRVSESGQPIGGFFFSEADGFAVALCEDGSLVFHEDTHTHLVLRRLAVEVSPSDNPPSVEEEVVTLLAVAVGIPARGFAHRVDVGAERVELISESHLEGAVGRDVDGIHDGTILGQSLKVEVGEVGDFAVDEELLHVFGGLGG